MGVQITVSGKLRGDRSAFEKHTQGILPRAGNYAKNLVSEDITHTKTPMGLIGIKIRIATKEKLIPEFQLNESSKTEKEEITKTETEEIKTETEEIAKTETEEIKTETEEIKTEKEEIAKTETEQIKIEEEKMKTLVTLEEEEEKLK